MIEIYNNNYSGTGDCDYDIDEYIEARNDSELKAEVYYDYLYWLKKLGAVIGWLFRNYDGQYYLWLLYWPVNKNKIPKEYINERKPIEFYSGFV